MPNEGFLADLGRKKGLSLRSAAEKEVSRRLSRIKVQMNADFWLEGSLARDIASAEGFDLADLGGPVLLEGSLVIAQALGHADFAAGISQYP